MEADITTPLSHIESSRSLDRLAYDKIKSAILNFRLLPGQSLVEADLAEQLMISKTPVRDALMRLQREGLVKRLPYKGSFVSEISNQDMVDIFEIRIVLESLAASLVSQEITHSEIDEMEKLIEQHEYALKFGKNSEIAQSNAKFHHLIVSRCTNPHLHNILNEIDDKLKRYRALSISQDTRRDKSVKEHRVILNALREKDAQGAEKAMKNHLQSAMQDLYDQDFEALVQKIVASENGFDYPEIG